MIEALFLFTTIFYYNDQLTFDMVTTILINLSLPIITITSLFNVFKT